MKKFLFLLIALIGAINITYAQAKKVIKQFQHQAAPFNPVYLTGLEKDIIPTEINTPTLPTHPLTNPNTIQLREEMETNIGLTMYDLQTNNTVQSRLQALPNGSVSATWTQGFEATNYPDRGTGYNRFMSGIWGDIPEERLESETRTGWPSLSRVADGSDVIVAHGGGLKTLRNPNRAWIEGSIESAADGIGLGMLWPRSATGGADGNSIHVVAITTPIANGGEPYLGVDGHILYFRSTDAGATWDKVDVVLPELDSTFYRSMNADSYYITARGETVALAIFSTFTDSKILISRDNGETWETSNLVDSPLDRYETDQGYTLDDIGGVYPGGPGDNETAGLSDSLAIFTTDNSGTAIIDLNDQVHVFWGEMFVTDADTTDGGTSFYPTWSGIRYWNESYPADSTRLVADLVDLNGNDTIDIAADNAEIAGYFTSLTSFPSVGVDASNQIYLAYSGLAEGFYNEEEAQFYRHVFVTASPDGGETWADAKDINIAEFSLEPDLVDFVEAVFPSISDYVGETIQLTYQLDYAPGLSARGDMDVPSTNFIMYFPLEPEFLGLTSSTEEVVQPDALGFKISPNPATEQVQIQLEIAKKSEVAYEIYNNVGQLVRNSSAETRAAGQLQFNVNTHDLPTGLYAVKVRINNIITTQKLVIK